MTDRELMQMALEALDNIYSPLHVREINKVGAAMKALRERLAQPEQYQRPQMRRATREEKIDRPGVYWVPVNNIANSEAIPEQISGPKQEPPNLNCKSVQARLAAQWGYVKPEQEPVAMRYDFDGYGYRYIDSGSGSNWQTRIKEAEPLYTAPPRREWQGLTDKEIAEAGKLWVEGERMLPFAFASAIEAKIKEKNA